MTDRPFDVRLDVEHRRCIVGDEPLIFHCHHYNTYLQRTIDNDTPDEVDAEPFLVGAAAEVAYHQLCTLFEESAIDDVETRKRVAETVYRWQGFGTFDLSELSPDCSSTLSTPHSHYELGWQAKWGQSDQPVSHFARGWLAGAAAAIYDTDLGRFDVEQVEGIASGGRTCRFEIEPTDTPSYDVYESVGVGRLTDHAPRPVPDNNVDYDGILEAVAGMPLDGDEEGNIPAFGVYLTRHFANYYCRISFELVRKLTEAYGPSGRKAAEPLLIEAGHVCAFNTFGGIMLSTEWDALIKPSLESRLDWVHGIVAVVNALGWGRWQVTHVDENFAEFVIHDDYEGVAWEAMYGKSDAPVEYLHRGGVAGLMNLIFHGDIRTRPTLDEAYYNKLFAGEQRFVALPLSSRACGDDVTRFEVVRANTL